MQYQRRNTIAQFNYLIAWFSYITKFL